MLKLIKEYKFYIVIIIFVFIPILSLNTSNKNATQFNFFDKIIVTLTAPLQLLIGNSINITVGFVENYFFLILELLRESLYSNLIDFYFFFDQKNKCDKRCQLKILHCITGIKFL